MNNRIIITFNANPTNFQILSVDIFEVPVVSGSWEYFLRRNFVTGTPINPFQIQIGSDLASTIDNLCDSLAVQIPSFVPGVVILNRSYEDVVELVFPAGDYEYEYRDSHDVDVDITIEASADPVIIPALDPLDVKDISISIIDTYTNSLPLIVEFPAEAACKIEWNGGDDLLKELMPSKLDFNMLVPNREDAHFLHLFTGDENRYRVELNAIDAANNAQLIWQGYLLPDQYKESYTTGVLFVDFVASDNLGTLKGKYFEPWFYHNKFPITELLAMILKMTGLNQELLIKPSLIPSFARVYWYYINVDLSIYYDGKKYGDVYKILTEVLQANLLTLKNYRGFWFIEGVTRKKDDSGTMFRFDEDGKYVGEMYFNKTVTEVLISEGSANITANTPFKKVNFNFEAKGDKNMFPETVVKIAEKDIFYNTNSVVVYDPALVYSDRKFKEWSPNLSSIFHYNFGNENVFNYGCLASIAPDDYNFTEAMALVNYIDCKETAFVKPNTLYALELEFFHLNLPSSSSEVSGAYYDKIFPYQLFLDGVELISNRPSYSSGLDLSYVVVEGSFPLGGAMQGSIFKSRVEFRVNTPGEISFRLLASIGSGFNGKRYCTKLALSVVEDYDYTENLSGVRNINYTQELDHDAAFTCSQDKSIQNSFGLGLPIDPNYFITLRDSDGPWFGTTTRNYFAPATIIDINVIGWELPAGMYEVLFMDGKKAACFIEKSSGDKLPFDNLYGSVRRNEPRRAYFIHDYVGYPVKPRKYFAYEDFEEPDAIKLMYVKYAHEDYNQRLSWKVYGSSSVDEFKKVLIAALHNINPEALYRLECQLLQRVLPDDLSLFFYKDQDRNFIPTTIKIDLFNTKTTIVATEAKYQELTDIIFE